MKITKQRLRQIIKEELGLGDIQTEPRFTGRSPEERMLLLIKAREVLTGLGEEEIAQLADGLDAETLGALEKLLDNPMFAPGIESKPLGRPEHDPLDTSPSGRRARRRLQGRGIKNYPLDK